MSLTAREHSAGTAIYFRMDNGMLGKKGPSTEKMIGQVVPTRCIVHEQR
jgi:hypothetical protein